MEPDIIVDNLNVSNAFEFLKKHPNYIIKSDYFEEDNFIFITNNGEFVFFDSKNDIASETNMEEIKNDIFKYHSEELIKPENGKELTEIEQLENQSVFEEIEKYMNNFYVYEAMEYFAHLKNREEFLNSLQKTIINPEILIANKKKEQSNKNNKPKI